MFRKRSLAGITAHFNRVIEELEELKARHTSDALDHATRIGELQEARNNLLAELQQAETIAVNLRSLLGQVA